MSKKYGNSWWDDKVNSKISRICKKRAAVDNNKFHYIFYAEFLDLKMIIENNWEDLGNLLKGNKENLNKLVKINKKRNIIVHGR